MLEKPVSENPFYSANIQKGDNNVIRSPMVLRGRKLNVSWHPEVALSSIVNGNYFLSDCFCE